MNELPTVCPGALRGFVGDPCPRCGNGPCARTSNQYLSIRKRHLATLREIARDGTVEVGQFKAALQWAISRLDRMPEHWIASPDETSAKHDDKDIRMFLGWLAVELPELRNIETPRLGAAWEKWRALMDDSSLETEAFTPSQIGQIVANNCEPCDERCEHSPEEPKATLGIKVIIDPSMSPDEVRMRGPNGQEVRATGLRVPEKAGDYCACGLISPAPGYTCAGCGRRAENGTRDV